MTDGWRDGASSHARDLTEHLGRQTWSPDIVQTPNIVPSIWVRCFCCSAVRETDTGAGRWAAAAVAERWCKGLEGATRRRTRPADHRHKHSGVRARSAVMKCWRHFGSAGLLTSVVLQQDYGGVHYAGAGVNRAGRCRDAVLIDSGGRDLVLVYAFG